MKRALAIFGSFGIVMIALATASFDAAFMSTYKVQKDSVLGKAQCMICHAGAKGGKLNSYGKDVQAAMRKAKATKLTPAILKSVEGLDSNGDGMKNGDSIRKGELPGK